MNKHENIKSNYQKLYDSVKAYTNEKAFCNYILSCLFRIWGANMLYSPSYSDVVFAVSANKYTTEQLITAMSCCSDTDRKLLVPKFFKESVEKSNVFINNFLPAFQNFLYECASVNGDFTKSKAEAVNEIISTLGDYYTKNTIYQLPELKDLSSHITEQNEESYLTRAEIKSPETSSHHAKNETVTKSEEPEPIKIEVTLKADITEPSSSQQFTINRNDEPDSKTVKSEYTAVPTDNVTHPEDNRKETLESLLLELDSLVGLETVKEDVHTLINLSKVLRIREQRGMKVPVVSKHLVFTGNPGTGKTTVARLVAKLYYHIGLLPQGQLIEADRSSLVAGYLGQTAIKTQKVIQQALGGVLFIDEAYALTNKENGDMYGDEAIETILKAMEDHRDELIVIVAGYSELMQEFINSNPGLSSRFNKYIHFPDYTGDELLKIFIRFCHTNGYRLQEEAKFSLELHLHRMYNEREEHFGNARAVRNIFERAINIQANRIANIPNLSDYDLELLTIDDILEAIEE